MCTVTHHKHKFALVFTHKILGRVNLLNSCTTSSSQYRSSVHVCTWFVTNTSKGACMCDHLTLYWCPYYQRVSQNADTLCWTMSVCMQPLVWQTWSHYAWKLTVMLALCTVVWRSHANKTLRSLAYVKTMQVFRRWLHQEFYWGFCWSKYHCWDLLAGANAVAKEASDSRCERASESESCWACCGLPSWHTAQHSVRAGGANLPTAGLSWSLQYALSLVLSLRV